ncbi:Dabb family protein [Oryzibacter oryziterrae]|uniref:Dabb family protein n=1 Tax=Oryzibacter oryziterrae TaxID=2766474 RepID=UPI001F3B37AC|nr:Dabb family protein [Oryzibacter oryziterrae]
MILHCVFLRFPAGFPEASKQALYDEVARLQAVVPGMIGVRSGANMSPEGLARGFEDGFIVTFKERMSRDAYLVHPQHVVVGDKIVAATEGGLDGVFVYDLELADLPT